VSLPAISVLLPVFNAERYLGAALESVLAQTFTDFECVIVDDGSTDTSPTILAQYAAHDGRIRIIRQKNLGIVAALNRGLADCRAPLVARMDADDVCHPARLQHQIHFMHARPDVAVVGTAIRLVDEIGRPGPVIRHPARPAVVARALQHGNVIAHPTVMMRTAKVVASGGYREALRHAEDYDLWLRISDRSLLANLPTPLIDYRVHARQISWEQAEAQAIRMIAAQVLARQRRHRRIDDVDRCGTADLELLLADGIPRRRIEEAVIAAIAGRVALCSSVGMTAEAAQIRGALLRRPADRELQRFARAGLAYADLIAATRRRRWAEAIVASARCGLACVAAPAVRRMARERLGREFRRPAVVPGPNDSPG